MKKILSLLLVSVSLFLLIGNTNASEKCGLGEISDNCSIMENKISKVMNNFFKKLCSENIAFEIKFKKMESINNLVKSIKEKKKNNKMIFEALALIEKNINKKQEQILNKYIGTWKNDDEDTKGIKEIVFTKGDNNYLNVKFSGNCDSVCDGKIKKVDVFGFGVLGKKGDISYQRWFEINDKNILKIIKVVNHKYASKTVLTKESFFKKVGVEIEKQNFTKKEKAEKLIGTWINTDTKTRGTTKLVFRKDGNKTVVHVWGACHPSDCDNGEGNVNIDFMEANFGSSDRAFEFITKDRIKMKTITRYQSRPDRKFIYYFKKNK